MTLVQFFYNLENGKMVAVEIEDSRDLCFFQLNDDPEDSDEYPYLGIFQEGLTPHYFGFTKEKLIGMIEKQPEVLKYAYVAEIDKIIDEPTVWQRIKFFFTGSV